jgi:DNA-binding XRE family transcriptional regulator
MIMAATFHELARKTMSRAAIERSKARARELVLELDLNEIRKKSGKTQKQIAKLLGIRQPSLSKLEQQSDMQISTLQRIIEALGGSLEVHARFPTGTIRLRQFHRLEK